MAKTEENLSQSKYAAHRNVTKGYISRMIKEGRLHLIKGKLNVEMSDAELDNKSNNDKAPNYWSEKALQYVNEQCYSQRNPCRNYCYFWFYDVYDRLSLPISDFGYSDNLFFYHP